MVNDKETAVNTRLPVPRFLFLLVLLPAVLLAGPAAAAAEPVAGEPGSSVGPEWVGAPVTPSSWDGDIRDLPPAPVWKPGDPIIEIPRRFYADPSQALAHAPFWLDVQCDPLVAKQAEYDAQRDRALAGPMAITAPVVNVAGQGYTNLAPPDVAGDVGPNHYIQAINSSAGSAVQIYDKTGAKIGASFSMKSLGGTSPCNNTYGDPIVLYDRLADRWFLLEFTTTAGRGLCVHISKTADPVAGGWWNYSFVQASFPDYPHCAVWWDGYYCTANEGNPPVYVLDRQNMLNGTTARAQQTFRATPLAGYGFQALTPVDFTGPTAAPAGAPFIAVRHNDDEAHAGAGADGTKDFIDIYSVAVNWTTPASSVFTTLPRINISEFNSWFRDYSTFATVPQPTSTTARLDPIREVILNRSNYMNFGDHEAIVGDFATNIDPARTGTVVDSGVRWFELRRTPPGSGNWALYQEGTYGDGGNTKHHLEGSIAINKAGSIGLGFNVTQTVTPYIYASIKYSGRLASDTTGVMTQGESNIILGAAVETSGRWGDYPTMSLDPSDDCTFWFTHEYRPATNWATQIASFKILPNAPAAPSFANVACTTLTVNWAAAGGAATYDVYRAAGAACTGAVKITATPVSGLTYNDTGLTGGTQYSYYVVANSVCGSSANGTCSTQTTLASCTPGETSPGGTPATSQNWTDKVTHAWQAVSGATSYNLYRGVQADLSKLLDTQVDSCLKYTGTALTTATLTEDPSAVAGRFYWYVVTASNASGEGPAGNATAGPRVVNSSGACP